MSLTPVDTTFSYDNLLAGDFDIITRPITILSGSGVLARGTVLGAVSAGTTATSAANAGNTGNGVMGAVTVSAGAKAGVHRLIITAAAANAGTFGVEDPDGLPLPDGTVGVAYAHNGLAFTLADGATDFVVGDGFSITVAAGTGKGRLVNSANTDGSSRPIGVLAEDVDATSADVVATYYQTGEFNENKLIFGGSDTVETHRAALRDLSIFMRKAVPA